MEAIMQEIAKNTKDVQNFWETRMSQWMEECVKSQDFVGAMTKSLESSLDFRKMIDSSMTRWAEAFHIVTKKDVATLQQQMFDNNLRLEKMYNLMQDMYGRMTGVTAPANETGAKEPKKKGTRTAK